MIIQINENLTEDTTDTKDSLLVPKFVNFEEITTSPDTRFLNFARSVRNGSNSSFNYSTIIIHSQCGVYSPYRLSEIFFAEFLQTFVCIVYSADPIVMQIYSSLHLFRNMCICRTTQRNYKAFSARRGDMTSSSGISS